MTTTKKKRARKKPAAPTPPPEPAQEVVQLKGAGRLALALLRDTMDARQAEIERTAERHARQREGARAWCLSNVRKLLEDHGRPLEEGEAVNVNWETGEITLTQEAAK